MSIHVTVKGNPVYQRRILLTDIETAKKNEWLRRRKIRLQQARQQAKDLAQNVRQKVSSEKNTFDKCEQEKHFNQQRQKKKEKLDCLQQEIEECISNVGSGHQLASLQNECDALLREKEELREEIARARGAIAEERLRAEKCLQKEKAFATTERKQLARKIEDLRSNFISNLPKPKPSCSSEKKISVKAQVHRGADESVSSGKKFEKKTASTETDKGAPLLQRRESQSSQRKKSTISDGEDFVEESDDDSDVTWPPRSARVVKEPIPSPRVRFYDHTTRVTKECPKPSYSVTHADPHCQPDMREAIAEEEEACVRKENLDILARREKMARGSRALRKEREKREAERLLKEIEELEKRRKIQMAINKSYPSHFHEREDYRELPKEIREDYRGLPKEMREDRFFSSVHERDKEFEETIFRKEVLPKPVGPGQKQKGTEYDPRFPPFRGRTNDTGDEELLTDLINRLKEERAKKQRALEDRFGVKGLEEVDVPLWIPQTPQKDKNTQAMANQSSLSSSPEKSHSVQTSPKKGPQENINNIERRSSEIHNFPPSSKCACSVKCVCSKDETENSNLAEERNELSSTPGKIIEEEAKNESPKNYEAIIHRESFSSQQQGLQQNAFDDKEKHAEKSPTSTNQGSPAVKVSSQETVSSSTNSTSHADTVESSLSYEGVKVVVKVCDKSRKRKSKSPEKPTKKDKDVQTSLQDSSSKSVSWNSHFVTEGTSTSTSYLSPPSRLSPAQQSIIRSVLSKIDSRTKNPKLHSYIKRVLDMTRESIDNLPVSSVSDISINSSIFEKSKQPLPNKVPKKYDACCQAGNSLEESTNQEEALKFSELARCYADRVNDLAGMIDALRILPTQERAEDETSYLSPPEDIRHSFRLSNSIQQGLYPRPIDISDIPTSIQPHPCNVHPQQQNDFQRRIRSILTHDLSTIQEGETLIERDQVEAPRVFDPDVSSIKGTPQKRKGVENGCTSTGSSLGLLDDKDISSFLGSSSDDFEDVFRSLGIAWALPTVRKTRESRKLSRDSSSSSGHMLYSHSTPLAQSPVKGSPIKMGPSSIKQGSSSKNDKNVDTDSLTPPTFSLNIPRLSQYLSPSSENKHK